MAAGLDQPRGGVGPTTGRTNHWRGVTLHLLNGMRKQQKMKLAKSIKCEKQVERHQQTKTKIHPKTVERALRTPTTDMIASAGPGTQPPWKHILNNVATTVPTPRSRPLSQRPGRIPKIARYILEPLVLDAPEFLLDEKSKFRIEPSALSRSGSKTQP